MKTIGVIGLGVMATRMITNTMAYGGFRISAAWDPDPGACERLSILAPDIRIVEDPEALIDDDALDGIYIASPPASHVDYATAAVTRGKPILCEKPLGIDLATTRRMTETAITSDVRNAVNFTFATAPAVTEIENALADGTVGNVAAVDIRLHFCKWPREWQAPATWLSERTEGGFVRETFSHYAYLADRLFGPATLEHAVARYPIDNTGAESHALALMSAGGVPITFAGGTGGLNASGADRIDFTVWGTNVAYRLFDWNRLLSSHGDGWKEHLEEITDARQEGYRRQVGAIGAFFNGHKHPLPDFAQAFRIQELVEAILAAKA
jgi:1,5-anhydro-D-fructose reductase (1,5-anhydro-D-mannitol-forming)